MDQQTLQQLERHFEKLPKEYRAAIKGIGLKERLEAAHDRIDISEEKSGIFDTEIIIAIFGIEPVDDFPDNLARELELEEEEVQEITGIVNDEVFQPVSKLYQEVKTTLQEQQQEEVGKDPYREAIGGDEENEPETDEAQEGRDGISDNAPTEEVGEAGDQTETHDSIGQELPSAPTEVAAGAGTDPEESGESEENSSFLLEKLGLNTTKNEEDVDTKKNTAEENDSTDEDSKQEGAGEGGDDNDSFHNDPYRETIE